MKYILTAVLAISCSLANAQQKPTFRLNVNTNYVFDDKVDSYYSQTNYYDGTVKGNFQWGLGLEYMYRPSQGFELTYLRMDTKAPTTYYDPNSNPHVQTKDFDLAVNYIFLGGTRYFKTGGKFEPYAGLQAGMGIFDVSNPTNGNGNTSSKFAWGMKLGANIWLTPKVAIKLQGGLQSAAEAVGGGLYFGTGGVGAGLTSYSTIYQFSLGGGLAFSFGG